MSKPLSLWERVAEGRCDPPQRAVAVGSTGQPLSLWERVGSAGGDIGRPSQNPTPLEQVTELFGLGHTVTLYDLTNTFLAEGRVPKTRPKPTPLLPLGEGGRSDCALLTPVLEGPQ